MFESLTKLVDISTAHKEKLRAEGEVAIKAALKEFLDAHPTVEHIRWTQYAPHFNDGEACVFGVHSPEVVIDGEQLDEYPLDDGPMKTHLRQLEGALGELSDVLESLFGDHAEVIVTRTDISVNEYSHD